MGLKPIAMEKRRQQFEKQRQLTDQFGINSGARTEVAQHSDGF